MSSSPETNAPKQTGRSVWSVRPAGKSLPLLLLELFVAVCLTVNFFHLVRGQCLPKRSGNVLPALTFSYLSPRTALSPDDILQSWRTRLLAPALSSWLLDRHLVDQLTLRSGKYRTFLELTKSSEFQNVFGFYHSFWLFLSLLVLILFRKDALLLLLGVFAGLMYNLIEPSGAYYYPWDLPALFLFTLACVLFDRGWIWPLLPVVVLGSLFKESVLCAALLVLLGGHWNWWKRTAGFLAVVLATFGLNRLLMAHYGAGAQLLTMNSATSTAGLFQTGHLFENIRTLFSLDLNHVLFVNAGSLFLAMLFPWRNRRDVVFKVTIAAFAAGQFCFGVVNEVRIWYELLPLGWLLLSEALSRQWTLFNGAADASAESTPLMKRSYWSAMAALLVLALGVRVVAQFKSTPRSVSEKSPEEYIQGLITAANTGNPLAQLKVGQAYEDRQEFSNALPWFQKAGEQGLAEAQYRLGVLYFNVQHDAAQAARWFDLAAAQGHAAAMYSRALIYWEEKKFDQAIPLFTASAEKDDMYSQWMLGSIHLNAQGGDPVVAYKWLKLAQLKGFNAARADLEKCTGRMTSEQIAEAERLVKEFQEANRPPK